MNSVRGDPNPGLTFFSALIVAVFAVPAMASGDDSVGTESLKLFFDEAKPGITMRVLRTDGTLIEGSLMSAYPVTLLDPVTAHVENVNFETVDSLWEMRISKAKGQAIGGTFGLLVGGLTGLALGLGLHDYGCSFGDCEGSSSVPAAVGGGFFGALVGGCAGLLIGDAVSKGSPEWVRRYPPEDDG